MEKGYWNGESKKENEKKKMGMEETKKKENRKMEDKMNNWMREDVVFRVFIRWTVGIETKKEGQDLIPHMGMENWAKI